MVRPVIAVFAFAICAVTTLPAVAFDAYPHWNGAGWYRMKERMAPGEFWIDAGPFPSERVCKATLPVEKALQRSRCEYLATQPMWDIS